LLLVTVARETKMDTLQERNRNLTHARKGEEVRVSSLKGHPDLCARLQEYGFTPGCAVRLYSKAPLGGPMSFDLRGGRVALRQSDAACVLI